MTDVEETILSYKKHLERYGERDIESVKDKVLHCLKKLKKLPVTLEHLQSTKIGKVVNNFRKHDNSVGPKAKELVNQWKNLVPASPTAAAQEEDDEGYAEENGSCGSEELERENSASPRLAAAEHVSPSRTAREETPELQATNNGDLDLYRDEILDETSSKSREKSHRKHASRDDEHKSSRDQKDKTRDKNKQKESDKRDRRREDRHQDKHHEKSRETSRETVDEDGYREKSHKDHRDKKSDESRNHNSHRDDKHRDKSKTDKYHDKSRADKPRERVREDKHSEKTSSDKNRDKSREDKNSEKSSSDKSRDKSRDDKCREKQRKIQDGEKSRDRESSRKESGEKSNCDKSREPSPYVSASPKISNESSKSSRTHQSSKSSRERTGERDEKYKSKSSDSKSNVDDSRKHSSKEKMEKYSPNDSDIFDRLKKDYDRSKNGHTDELKSRSHLKADPSKASCDTDRRKDRPPNIDDKRAEKKRSEKLEPQSEDENASNNLSFEEKIANFRAQLGVTMDIFGDSDEQSSEKKQRSAPGKENAKKKESSSKSSSKTSSHDKSAKVKEVESGSKGSPLRNGFQDQDIDSNNGFSFADALGFGQPAAKPKKKTADSKAKENSAELPKSSSQSRSKSSSNRESRDKHKSSSHSSSHSKSKSSSHSHSKSHSSDKSSKHSSHSSSKSRDKDGKSKEKSESRKRKGESLHIPIPSKEVKLSTDDIMGTLPEISPNYKPLPSNRPGFTSPSRHGLIDENQIAAKKHGRSQVYAGRRQRFITSVPRLYDACLSVLKDNIDALEYVGGVPYFIMKPVLEKCTPTQLLNIEEYNAEFVEESDELWEKHCKREFKACEPEEFETWRELYLRKLDEREQKFKKLTANITHNKEQSKPVRKTQLAYVDAIAKAPRGVRRQQVKYGTAGPVHKKVDPLGKLTSHRGGEASSGTPGSSSGGVSAVKARGVGTSLLPPPDPVQHRQRKSKPSKAPMMMKSLKMMKGLRR